jgi:hypothetical protein
MWPFTKTKRYIFIVRNKSGFLQICDDPTIWERLCNSIARDYKGAEIVHPKDWDDESYVGQFFISSLGIVKDAHKNPDFYSDPSGKHLMLMSKEDGTISDNLLKNDFENHRQGQYTPDAPWLLYNAILKYVGITPDDFKKMTLDVINVKKELGIQMISVRE